MQGERPYALGRGRPGGVGPAAHANHAAGASAPARPSHVVSRRLEAQFLDAISRSDRILEVGCGGGSTCNALARGGYLHVVGVDADPDAVERARQAAARLEAFPVPEFLLAAPEALPFDDAAFTVALAWLGDRRGERLAAALAELHRVLAPAGRLFAAFGRAEPAPQPPEPWTPDGLAVALRAAGFEPRDIHPDGPILLAVAARQAESPAV